VSDTVIGKIIILIALAIIVSVLIFSNYGKSHTVRYDCSMADWHPDIPNSVKEECRRIRYEHWKKQLEESNHKSTNV
jgi:hypothetical protein